MQERNKFSKWATKTFLVSALVTGTVTLLPRIQNPFNNAIDEMKDVSSNLVLISSDNEIVTYVEDQTDQKGIHFQELKSINKEGIEKKLFKTEIGSNIGKILWFPNGGYILFTYNLSSITGEAQDLTQLYLINPETETTTTLSISDLIVLTP